MVLEPLINFSQDLTVTQKVTDESDELNTAKIVVDVKG